MREYIPAEKPNTTLIKMNSGVVPSQRSRKIPPIPGNENIPQIEVILETQDMASAKFEASVFFKVRLLRISNRVGFATQF